MSWTINSHRYALGRGDQPFRSPVGSESIGFGTRG